MKQKVSTPVVVAALVVVLAVLGYVGYKMLGSPQTDVSPQQQIEQMKNMKKGP